MANAVDVTRPTIRERHERIAAAHAAGPRVEGAAQRAAAAAADKGLISSTDTTWAPATVAARQAALSARRTDVTP